ncbi:hypothetical protein GH733_008524, partial [Mirounga leonina]
MNNQKQQKPTLSGQRFKTRKRDEKERFDPTQFQDCIIQGLTETGTDLEAVAKFLDASGAKLDYRRYAETLFDILVAGGMLGGTLADDMMRTDVCVFAAQEDLETMQAFAQVFNKLIRRYKYLEKGFEDEVKKGFSESERNKLAMLTGVLLANGTLNASILNSLYNENLVKEGVSAAFAVKLFKSWINEKDINAVAASLRKVSMDNRLMELFPANKQSVEHFTKYFTEAGLKELSEYVRNQQTIGARKELQKELQEQMSRGDPFKDQYSPLLAAFTTQAEVLSEEPILKWYKDAHVAKGKSVFLEQMKKFVEWLKNAEEESESEAEEVRSNGPRHGKQLKNGENWIADLPDSCWHSEPPQVQPSK